MRNWHSNMVPRLKSKSRINISPIFRSVLWVLILGVMTMGCSGSKKLKKDAAEFQPTELNSFFNQLDFLEMRGKIKVSMVEDGTTYNANITVREKDNTTWFIIKFLGIEFLRGLIDQNGVQILDRSNREYLTSSWEDIRNKYNQELSYEVFRNLLFGNPFLFRGVNYGYYKSGNSYEYDYTSDTSKLLISILFSERIKQALWVLENDKIAIESNYDQYDSPTLKNIPYFRQYIVYFHNTQPINIQMEIKNYSFDDTITIPFEVPDRYSRSDLVVR